MLAIPLMRDHGILTQVAGHNLDVHKLAPPLIIGKEDVMVPIRRALGYHGNRYGTTASYGKAAFVGQDPGKEGLSGQVAALRVLRDNPVVVTKPVEELYQIVKEEFAKIDPRIRPHFQIYKSVNCGAVEVNYEDSWKEENSGSRSSRSRICMPAPTCSRTA
jgi:hypothetical protein